MGPIHWTGSDQRFCYGFPVCHVKTEYHRSPQLAGQSFESKASIDLTTIRLMSRRLLSASARKPTSFQTSHLPAIMIRTNSKMYATIPLDCFKVWSSDTFVTSSPLRKSCTSRVRPHACTSDN